MSHRIITDAPDEIDVPEFGQIDPGMLDGLLRQNLLLASHNAALTQACQALRDQVASLRAELAEAKPEKRASKAAPAVNDEAAG